MNQTTVRREKAAAKRQAWRMTADLILASLSSGWLVTKYEEEALEEIILHCLRRGRGAPLRVPPGE